ncbi:helix-turn-helix domain-containing protein [Zunongwangia sp. H14]|uniref:helix-turn-helix domain-containing protein n=1 Tax=Zunongwangia sp. H14 TaxID=3240792 RepID=UPI003563C922
MPASIITTDDLREFKTELLEEIKSLLDQQSSGTLKQYFKSSDVMEFLQISPGTLQNLRTNGTLPYTKIGGIIYYEAADVQKAMDQHRTHHNSGFRK